MDSDVKVVIFIHAIHRNEYKGIKEGYTGYH